jgi:hypothetical protein
MPVWGLVRQDPAEFEFQPFSLLRRKMNTWVPQKTSAIRSIERKFVIALRRGAACIESLLDVQVTAARNVHYDT